ncbi:cell division protein FtsQ [Desulfovibrionales bacterium]
MPINKQRTKCWLFSGNVSNHYKYSISQNATQSIGRSSGRKHRHWLRLIITWAEVRRFWMLSLYFSLGMAFFSIFSIGLLTAYRWMTSNDYFALSDIKVCGNKRLSYEDVIAQSGLFPSQNSLRLNIKEIETSLMQNPWIKAVSVKRVLPDRLQIALTERTPRFWVKRERQIWYADAEGQLIAPVDMDKFTAMPLIQQTDDADFLLPQLTHLACFGVDRNIPVRFEDASWIKLSYGKGFELYFEKYQCSISIDIKEWEENLVRLRTVWNDLERRKELNDIKSINIQGSNVWIVRTHDAIG